MMEAFAAFLAEAAEKLGLPGLVPEENGMVSLEIDGRQTLNLRFSPQDASITVFTEVAVLPEGTPEAVYRSLLTAMLFGRGSAGGTFSLEPVGASLVYTHRFAFSPDSDAGAFVTMLEQLLDFVGQWRERIAQIAAGESAPTADDAPLTPQEAAFNPSEMFFLRP